MGEDRTAMGGELFVSIPIILFPLNTPLVHSTGCLQSHRRRHHLPHGSCLPQNGPISCQMANQAFRRFR